MHVEVIAEPVSNGQRHTSTRCIRFLEACKHVARCTCAHAHALFRFFLCSRLKKETTALPRPQLALTGVWRGGINLHLFCAAKTVTAPLGQLIDAPFACRGGSGFVSAQITQETREPAMSRTSSISCKIPSDLCCCCCCTHKSHYSQLIFILGLSDLGIAVCQTYQMPTNKIS